MSYEQMDQLVISTITVATGQGAALSAVAKIGQFAPGHQAIEIRGVSVVVTTTATVTAPVVDFYRRPTAGADTSRVLIKRLNPVLGSWVAGNTIYGNLEGTTTLSTTINPGEDVNAEVSTAATAGNGHACILFQPKWINPITNTKMILV